LKNVLDIAHALRAELTGARQMTLEARQGMPGEGRKAMKTRHETWWCVWIRRYGDTVPKESST
jgi:hypothetical protein